MNSVSALVLGAGKGSRMKSSRSKVLHKIGGLEMIGHVVKNLNTLSTDEIILVVSEDNGEEIKNIMPTSIKAVIQIDRNGTAGAARVGVGTVENRDNFLLVTHGDVPFIEEATYEKMIDNLQNTGNSVVALGFHTRNVNNEYGRLIVNKKNELAKIIEYRDATDSQRKNTLCNAGTYAIRNSKLLEIFLDSIKNDNSAGEYYLTDIIEVAIGQGHKCGCVMADEREVIGINSRKDLSIAEQIFQNAKREEFMNKGVTLVDPSSVFFSHDTEIDSDVTIEPNVVFKNGVKIHSRAEIKSFSHLEGCEIGNGATIGPFARIRPASTLGENSRVGNFCEIKASNVGKGVKISHLSYLGDSEIGEGANIGAGTITCNYDGYSKFKTKIGKNCFIGSNTTMVAPIEIGENCLTAAGSVITKNVDSNSLTVARAEQRVIVDGMKRYREKREKRD
ncbi:bifunctional protein GlmU [Bacilli bacterium]|nr:bifunctional protein GlmU [Bacilli bacterium]